MTVKAKPLWRRSERTAWPKSLRRSVQKGGRNSLRASSFQCSRAPNSSWARRRASSGLMPWRMYFSVAMSMWKRTSSSRRFSRSLAVISILGEPEHQVHSFGHPCPLGPFGVQVAAAGGGEGVEAGPAVVVGEAPLGAEQALPLEPVERGVERALVHGEDLERAGLDPLGDAPAVHGTQAEGLEHQHVEGALEQAGGKAVGGGAGHGSSLRASKGRWRG